MTNETNSPDDSGPQSKGPGGGNAEAQPMLSAESDATIEAVVQLVARRRGGRHHVVCLRRNPAGGRRPWLAAFNNSGEFPIATKRLLSRRRFGNVAESSSDWQRRGGDDLVLPLALHDLPEQAIWRAWMLDLMAVLEGGRGRAS
jgi:hypothetical protein